MTSGVTAAILVATLNVHAQPAPNSLTVRWESGGVLRLSQSGRDATIDLSEDIVGCLGQLYDGATRERFGSGEGPNKVLDVAEVEGRRFLLLSAAAAPNCNVQGACGAGDPNVTLIWLHIAPDLSVAAKKTFTVEDCLAARWVEGEPEDWRGKLALSDGVLALRFKEIDRRSTDMAEITGRVTYDRKTPAAGIVISRATQH